LVAASSAQETGREGNPRRTSAARGSSRAAGPVYSFDQKREHGFPRCSGGLGYSHITARPRPSRKTAVVSNNGPTSARQRSRRASTISAPDRCANDYDDDVRCPDPSEFEGNPNSQGNGRAEKSRSLAIPITFPTTGARAKTLPVTDPRLCEGVLSPPPPAAANTLPACPHSASDAFGRREGQPAFAEIPDNHARHLT